MTTLRNQPPPPETEDERVARIERTQGPSEIYHYDLDRVSQIFVSASGHDLAGTGAEVERIVANFPARHTYLDGADAA